MVPKRPPRAQRLNVRVSDAEMRMAKHVALCRDMTLPDYVRRLIREAYDTVPDGTIPTVRRRA